MPSQPTVLTPRRKARRRPYKRRTRRGDRFCIRVKLCWPSRKTAPHKSVGYASQLIAKIKNGDWEGSIKRQGVEGALRHHIYSSCVYRARGSRDHQCSSYSNLRTRTHLAEAENHIPHADKEWKARQTKEQSSRERLKSHALYQGRRGSRGSRSALDASWC